jgi:hypothetical protein
MAAISKASAFGYRIVAADITDSFKKLGIYFCIQF